MANQDAAFGLRPLKTVGQQDDSTGMASYNISPGDASAYVSGIFSRFACYRNWLCRHTNRWPGS